MIVFDFLNPLSGCQDSAEKQLSSTQIVCNKSVYFVLPTRAQYTIDSARSESAGSKYEATEPGDSESQTVSDKTISSSKSRTIAWRFVGADDWQICANMAEACLQIVRAVASMDYRGENEFYQVVSTKIKFVQRSNPEIESLSHWKNLNENWLFNSHASNEGKLNTVKKIVGECIDHNHRHVEFSSIFEFEKPSK